MNHRRNEDRVYPAVLLAFLVGLITLGLLGVPALLVAAIGLVVATGAIALLHVDRGRGRRVPEKYVPSVLEGSGVKRRRLAHLKRDRGPQTPLRFR